MKTRIAFLYIAEAYQTYHNASVAFELAKREDCLVEIFYSDSETPQHIERIRQALDGPRLKLTWLRRSPLLRAIQATRVLGFWKEQVMRENVVDLDDFDAIVCAENTDSYLRKVGLSKPLLIYMPHGAGDRAIGYHRDTAKFDFVTPPGEKCANRMLSENLIRPGRYMVPGYIKFEIAQKLGLARAPLFNNDRPIVFYNAHRAPEFSSWPRFIEPILSFFAAHTEFNLIVAPHVKMFHRLPDRIRERWRNRSTENILIDTGSWSCLDMTYTEAADIYIGDVSSQVYEFLTRPKPCIFLNAHHAEWRGDPNFAHWHFGDVIEEPEQLADALQAAPARHHHYRDIQIEKVAQSLGDITPGATARAAEAILSYVRQAGAR